MMRLALSSAAAALLRALIARSGEVRDQVLLIEWASTDWQSLTSIGERHIIALKLCGPQATAACARLTSGLADAEFALPGHVLADIALIGEPELGLDGSRTVRMEALTVME